MIRQSSPAEEDEGEAECPSQNMPSQDKKVDEAVSAKDGHHDNTQGAQQADVSQGG